MLRFTVEVASLVSGPVVGNSPPDRVSVARHQLQLLLLLLPECPAESSGASCRDPEPSGRQGDACLSLSSALISEFEGERRHVGRSSDVGKVTSRGTIGRGGLFLSLFFNVI